MNERRPPTASDPPPPRAKGWEDLADRLHAVEVKEATHHSAVITRLDNGAATFAELKQDVAGIKNDLKPKLPSVIAIIAILFTVGTAVFAAGTYPDRPTVERLEERLEAQINEQRLELTALKERIARLEVQLVEADKRRLDLAVRLDTLTRVKPKK